MIVSDLIKASLEEISVIAAGETPTSEDYALGLGRLQRMLRTWAANNLMVFASIKESFSLVSAQSSYSWGSGGTITTASPHQIIGAFVRDSSNYDYPVGIVSEGEYRRISSKTTSGRPSFLFYHPLYPLAYVYVYPTPQDVETVWIDSFKPFTETSSFDDLGSTLSFPPNYEEPLVLGLAIRLAPSFGKVTSAETRAAASNGFENLIILNAENQIEPVSLSLPAGMQTVYDINQG